MYGQGISKVGELLDIGVTNGSVEKSGSWYSYNEQRIGQGRENAKQFLLDHSDISNQIEDSIRVEAGLANQKTSKSAEKEVS